MARALHEGLRPRKFHVAAETFGHPEHVRIAREIRVLLEGGDAP